MSVTREALPTISWVDVTADGRGGRPAVSIVVICHNYGGFVAAAIDSALAQDYAPLDVVVIDDGSTDESRAVIAAFGTRVRAVLQPQGGHVSAFNRGFAEAEGAIVVFLDADDILYPHYVSTIVAAWEPYLVKVQCRLDTIDRNGVDQAMPFPWFGDAPSPSALRRHAIARGIYPWTVSTGNAFARRFLAEVLPIETTEAVSPDGYVNKLAPLYGEIKSINAILGAYRVHGGNAWARLGPHGGRILPPTGLARAVRLDAWNHQQFELHARRLGLAVPGLADLDGPNQMENRLVSLRLGPLEHPFPSDRRAALLRRGARGVVRAPALSTLGRLAWLAWLLLIAVAPRPLIALLFNRGRSQAYRSPAARLLVRLSRRH